MLNEFELRSAAVDQRKCNPLSSRQKMNCISLTRNKPVCISYRKGLCMDDKKQNHHEYIYIYTYNQLMISALAPSLSVCETTALKWSSKHQVTKQKTAVFALSRLSPALLDKLSLSLNIQLFLDIPSKILGKWMNMAILYT